MGKKRKVSTKDEKSLLSKVKENIGLILLLLGLIAGIFAFDSRYFKEAEAQQLAQQSLKALQNLQQQTNENFLREKDERLYDRQKDLKRQLRTEPKNQDLVDELNEVIKTRDSVQKKLSDFDKLTK